MNRHKGTCQFAPESNLLMIKQVRFKNWKSFKDATLPVDQLTVLIGTNASGKSNALDALEFLLRTANASDIQSAIIGDNTTVGIRGGVEWASHKGGKSFTIEVLTSGEDEKTDYEYSISITLLGSVVELLSEQLVRVRYQGSNERRLRLFWTDDPAEGAPGITARLYNTKAGSKQPVRRNLSVLSQLEIHDLRPEIKVGLSQVARSLRNIFILDPNPSSMRAYSRPSERLNRDASNVAGVLAALPSGRKDEVERAITAFSEKIPEKDIVRVWAETVDRHKVDAMLYCVEKWTANDQEEIDARGMSDGTLRFISVIAALLTQPKGSMIVIEEIDNGLHPSRAIYLLKAIREIGVERQIDLLITTHNVALLDALPPGILGSVAVATRNNDTGGSDITVLEDLPYLSRLMSEGSLGQLSAKGQVEQAVKAQNKDA